MVAGRPRCAERGVVVTSIGDSTRCVGPARLTLANIAGTCQRAPRYNVSGISVCPSHLDTLVKRLLLQGMEHVTVTKQNCRSGSDGD
jgi:hypothetical protein